MMKHRYYLLYTFCLMLVCSLAQAQPTDITVHVKAKGSKFIGSSMGGARIVIKEAMTGKILDEGKTAGGSGNTERIMKKALRSTQPLTDEHTARYEATIDLQEPTLIQVEAFGPLSQLQSAQTASATQWIIPGKHITGGDAFFLILPGMIVDIKEPAASSSFELGTSLNISAYIGMGCGCPITPGGLWDSDALEIKAMVSRDKEKVTDTDLIYAGTPSRFQGQLKLTEPGIYEILVYVYDPRNGNTGLDRTTVILRK